MGGNSVVFKAYQNGILIILDEKIAFPKLKLALTKKVESAKGFFDGANTSITFKGRKLSEDEEFELLDIVSKKSGLDISFVNKNEPSAEIEIPNPNNLKFQQERLAVFSSEKNMTNYHRGSLRSGQSIDFSGSVVVIGDVNPGAEIRAEGNIIVLGKLKGKVHAGCKGATDCFVSALYMNPTILIIGDIITYFPDSPNRKFIPEQAYVKDNQIFVEPLTNF